MQLLERVGVVAICAPAQPWSPLLNSVVHYDDVTSLADALPELEDAYDREGVWGWAVRSPEHDVSAGAHLAGTGFSPGLTVMRMSGPIVGAPIEARGTLDIVEEPTWEVVARCNDRAYSIPPDRTMAAVLSAVDDPSFRLYAARDRGEVAAALVSRYVEGDCYINFVATVPGARGAGIATDLVALALRDGRANGCFSGCGESTPAAVSLYVRVGGRNLGAVRFWQRSR